MNKLEEWLTGMYVMLEDLTEHEMAIIENWMRSNQQDFIGMEDYNDCLAKAGGFFDYWSILDIDLTKRITAQQAMDIAESNQ